MLFEKSQKLLFIGDSITDCDRAKPDGEGLHINRPLGTGYVSFVDALLQATYPERAIRVVNKGISGNTVRDLKGRWQEDVIAQKPDWLSIMIGINDVWRQYDMPFIKETHVYANEYEKTLRELVCETKPLVKGIILMTPYYLEGNKDDSMRKTMDEYGMIVKKIANETDSIFINTQAAFDVVLKEFYSASLAWDRVHPSSAGHMVLARAFLNAAGFDWKHSGEK
ncbi:GDSL family lipase [Bacillus sp. FJAT-27225]|uniref:SGNH/GDSL hydrolase family protein n=1 Tax=Bacillus sp. FJAT-27225 TaxID=1743144 RepID=UPI00080C2634|nr:SGNH/GDSL hydrolase family protein [Bacillus sp. FJAT-27225]OCA88131.1 GDSL family lipase [Bacillus sp. FJAT-27225]